MKKTFVLIISLIVLLVALTACSKEHEHSYTETIIEPTCLEQGYTLHKCSCDDEYKDSYVNALGHNYVNGVCSRCLNDTTIVTAEQWTSAFTSSFGANNFTMKTVNLNSQQTTFVDNDKLYYVNSGYYNASKPQELTTNYLYMELIAGDDGYTYQCYSRTNDEKWKVENDGWFIIGLDKNAPLPKTLDEARAVYFRNFSPVAFKNIGLAATNETNVANRQSLQNASSLFAYDSAKKAYCATNLKAVAWFDENNITAYTALCDMEIYIQVGYIAKVINTTKDINNPTTSYMTATYEVYDYNKTVVSLSAKDIAEIDELKSNFVDFETALSIYKQNNFYISFDFTAPTNNDTLNDFELYKDNNCLTAKYIDGTPTVHYFDKKTSLIYAIDKTTQTKIPTDTKYNITFCPEVTGEGTKTKITLDSIEYDCIMYPIVEGYINLYFLNKNNSLFAIVMQNIDTWQQAVYTNITISTDIPETSDLYGVSEYELNDNYLMFMIVTNSMSPALEMGKSYLFEKLSASTSLEVGDIVLVNMNINENTMTVAHRIVEIIDDNGTNRYVLKGDNNSEAVPQTFTRDEIIAKSYKDYDNNNGGNAGNPDKPLEIVPTPDKPSNPNNDNKVDGEKYPDVNGDISDLNPPEEGEHELDPDYLI